MKVDKKTINVEYNNERANQLNQLEKLILEKPIVVKEKAKKNKDTVVEAQPQELRRSTRERKQKRDDDYLY